MAAALVDTFIIVDILRGYPPAVTWFNAQPDLAVCRAVWLEVLEGVIDSHNQRAALVLLRRLQLEELITQDFVWATQQLQRLYLSHGIDAFDCTIAAVSFRLQTPLYTRNLKHFNPLFGALAVRPY